MLRCVAVAALLYGFGHPDCDAYRPLAFDRSLREFHRDVNRIAEVTTGAALVFDPARTLRSLDSLSGRMQAMLSNR